MLKLTYNIIINLFICAKLNIQIIHATRTLNKLKAKYPEAYQ